MRGLLMIAALVFSAAAVEVAAQRPAIIKHERIVSEYREAAPLVWRDRLILMTCVRPVSGSGDRYIRFEETGGDEPGREISRLGEGQSFEGSFLGQRDADLKLLGSTHCLRVASVVLKCQYVGIDTYSLQLVPGRVA